MAITDAQQAKQIMMKKGGPVHRHQLAKKRKDGKRPGYYGPDYGHSEDPGTDFGKDAYSGGPSNIDMGGGAGGSDRDFERARQAIDNRAAAAANAERQRKERERKERERIIQDVVRSLGNEKMKYYLLKLYYQDKEHKIINLRKKVNQS